MTGFKTHCIILIYYFKKIKNLTQKVVDKEVRM